MSEVKRAKDMTLEELEENHQRMKESMAQYLEKNGPISTSDLPAMEFNVAIETVDRYIPEVRKKDVIIPGKIGI